MKKLIIIFLLCFPSYSFGTTIIIFINLNKITIGADSRKFIRGFYFNKSGQRMKIDTFENICKISQVSGLWCTYEGYLADKLILATEQGIRENTQLDNRISAIKNNLYKYLIPQMNFIRKHDPDNYKLTSFKYFANVAICTFIKGKPFVYVIKINRISKIDQPAKISIEVDVLSNGQIEVLGRNNEIIKVAQGSNYFLENGKKGIGIPETMIDLIDVEAKYHPNEVGLPISIVELSYNNPAYWIYKGMCK